MNFKLLVAGTALVALAGAASAATTNNGAYAEPSQPIAYSKLNAYLHASPSRRAHGDWSLAAADTAQTGTAANASVTTQNGVSGMPAGANAGVTGATDNAGASVGAQGDTNAAAGITPTPDVNANTGMNGNADTSGNAGASGNTNMNGAAASATTGAAGGGNP